jgi:hypothetical protein
VRVPNPPYSNSPYRHLSRSLPKSTRPFDCYITDSPFNLRTFTLFANPSFTKCLPCGCQIRKVSSSPRQGGRSDRLAPGRIRTTTVGLRTSANIGGFCRARFHILLWWWVWISLLCCGALLGADTCLLGGFFLVGGVLMFCDRAMYVPLHEPHVYVYLLGEVKLIPLSIGLQWAMYGCHLSPILPLWETPFSTRAHSP